MKYGPFIREAGGWGALQDLLRVVSQVARRHEFPIAVRTTLIPMVNGREIEAIARAAVAAGAERMEKLDPIGMRKTSVNEAR